MAWTKKQLADAKRLYKGGKGRYSWPEAIAKATKGGTGKKKKTVSGTGKKKKAGKKVIIKNSVVKVAGIGAIGSMGMDHLRRVNNDMARLKHMLLNGRNLPASHKTKIRNAISRLNSTKSKLKSLI